MLGTSSTSELALKVKVSKEDFNRARCNLMLGKFLGKDEQEDYYLENPSLPFQTVDKDGSVETLEYLRIRFSTREDTLEYKKLSFEDKKERVIEEYEISTEDPLMLKTLFEKLGYTKCTLINKVRETFLTQKFYVALDRFIDHGHFIELLSPDPEMPSASDQLKQFIHNDLLIRAYLLQNRSYPDLFSHNSTQEFN